MSSGLQTSDTSFLQLLMTLSGMEFLSSLLGAHSWCIGKFIGCTGVAVARRFSDLVSGCALCRHPRQWARHGGLQQSFLSYPPPFQDEEDVGGPEPLWAARLSPQNMFVPTTHGSEQRADFVHSSHESSLSGFAQAFAPVATQDGYRQSPECIAYVPTRSASCEHHRNGERHRQSAAVPRQASYMKPTASSLAKTADSRSKSQECAGGGREPACTVRIPCPPSVDQGCGRNQADQSGHQQQLHTARSLSAESDCQMCMVGSPVKPGSHVSRVVDALMDVTQLQHDLKDLGGKHQTLQALSKVCMSAIWI